MANILSNAFKEADVVEGLTKKATTQDFKTAFEKHLKTLPTCEEPYNVCLVDGGRYQYQTLAGAQLEDGAIEYGNTYSDGKATGLKDSFARLLVDVNGKKGPNKAGKDLYVFYVTKYGIFADGTTTECSGLDCGAYVLANHKIWTGEVEEANNQGGGGEQNEGGSSSSGGGYYFNGSEILSECNSTCQQNAYTECEQVGSIYICDNQIIGTLSDYMNSYTNYCNGRVCSFIDPSSFEPLYNYSDGIVEFPSSSISTYSELENACSELGLSIPDADFPVMSSALLNYGDFFVIDMGNFDPGYYGIKNLPECEAGQIRVRKLGYSYGESDSYDCVDSINNDVRAICDY